MLWVSALRIENVETLRNKDKDLIILDNWESGYDNIILLLLSFASARNPERRFMV